MTRHCFFTQRSRIRQYRPFGHERGAKAVRTRFQTLPAAHHGRASVWAIAGVPAGSARRLDRWFDALCDLTLEQWAVLARESASADQVDGIERAIVAAIHDHRLDVAAWLLRDAVETTLHYALRASPRAPAVSPIELSRIQRATELAALAIATEAWLDRPVRDAQIAPFVFILSSASPRLLEHRRAIDRPPRQEQSRR